MEYKKRQTQGGRLDTDVIIKKPTHMVGRRDGYSQCGKRPLYLTTEWSKVSCEVCINSLPAYDAWIGFAYSKGIPGMHKVYLIRSPEIGTYFKYKKWT